MLVYVATLSGSQKVGTLHELPEWILSEAATSVTSPLVIIEELANICNTTTGNKMGLNVLSNHVKKLRFANAYS